MRWPSFLRLNNCAVTISAVINIKPCAPADAGVRLVFEPGAYRLGRTLDLSVIERELSALVAEARG